MKRLQLKMNNKENQLIQTRDKFSLKKSREKKNQIIIFDFNKSRFH